MCDFHSTVWRLIGQDVQTFHLPTNSHSEMVNAAGWRENEPNRKTVVFESEWNGDGEVPDINKLLKNNASECPAQVERAVIKYYRTLKAAITPGGKFDKIFSDPQKFQDVWEAAMKAGCSLDFGKIEKFNGYVGVHQGATLTAPALAEADSVDVHQGATLTAPKLKR